MSYLSNPASNSVFGLVVVGNNINVANGTISIPQSVDPTANVTFNTVTATSVQANSLTLNGATVVTSVVPAGGNGVSIANLVSNGPNVSFTVLNTGVLSLTAGQGITLSSNTGNITVSTSGPDNISVIGANANYTATANDEYIGVDSANLVTITLPTGTAGRVYYVKDEFGPGFGKINIVGTGGQQIDKANTYTINVPFQGVTAVFRGTSWHLI